MIDRATVDKILDAVRIEEVIGDFVSLRKRGANYWGLCPFHSDKSPSMSVSPVKGIFKCFSCGKAGTALSFLMEHEHLSYWEALKYLAKKYHIEVKEREESPEQVAERMRYESLLVVTEYAQKHFSNVLWNTDEGRAIGLSYFREREFTDETIRKFGLGFSQSKTQPLCRKAISEGYKKEYLLATGLGVERENGEIVDRFYDRVMFPIHSISGRVIAFGGRTLRSDKSVAKYVNSPETEIYVKNQSLYGIFQAKTAIVKEKKCILVEGYADVISMHQAGVENVVASSGTSLTVGQIRLIKRFTDNITIIYDGDAAGIKASLRGIDMVLEEGLKVKVVPLPPEDDPDTFAKSHSLPEILEYIKENERDFIAYKTEILLKSVANDPVSRAQVIADIVQSISVIPDQILRSVYVEEVSRNFSMSSETIFSRIAELRQKNNELRSSRERFENARNEERQEMVAGSASHPSETKSPKSVSGVTSDYLAVPEKELLYYLLKFGFYVIHFPEDSLYGVQPGEEVTVEQYITSALEQDEIVFRNPLYKNLYEQYLALTSNMSEGEAVERSARVQRYFSTVEDQNVVATVMDLICESHPITVKEYINSVVPEEQTLYLSVPKAVLNYKFRIVNLQCMELSKLVEKYQKEGDKKSMEDAARMLIMYNKIKNTLTKQMKRL